MNRRTFLGRMLAAPVALAGVVWGVKAGATKSVAGEPRTPVYIDGVKRHRDWPHPGTYSTIDGSLCYKDDIDHSVRCVINYDSIDRLESIHINRTGDEHMQGRWCRVVINRHA